MESYITVTYKNAVEHCIRKQAIKDKWHIQSNLYILLIH